MEKRGSFNKLSLDEFPGWIDSITVARKVSFVQIHHTWSPKYSDFDGNNHFVLQEAMKKYHVQVKGWLDIGQHLSIFPDGSIVTGRALNSTPACIVNRNSGAICIENLGNFDAGQDKMHPVQADAIVSVVANILRRFGISPASDNSIVYHHWFDLKSGARVGGGPNTKSCPGTAFFGGNSEAAAKAGFIPLVAAKLADLAKPKFSLNDYGVVTIDDLAVREGAGGNFARVQTQGSLNAGTVIRICGESAGWYKISNSKENWVYGKWVQKADLRTVGVQNAEIRVGPGFNFSIIHACNKGEDVYVTDTKDKWSHLPASGGWILTEQLTNIT